MATFLVLCSRCAKTLECLETNQGWMCLPCFHAAIDGGKEDISSFPEPDRQVYVLLWDEPGISFLTMDGVLYAFELEESATQFLAKLRRTGFLDEVKIRRLPAIAVLDYVWSQPGLKMKGIAGLKPDPSKEEGS